MRKWVPFLIAITAFVASAVVYGGLPGRVPTHWDASGDVNGWSSRAWGAFAIPLFIALLAIVMRLLPRIDPRGSNYAKFSGAFEGIMISVMLFLLALHIVVLRAALGYPVAMAKVVPFGVGALFVVIGSLLPRARPNWFVGIRTPWTLSSDKVWERTHRFGGRVFVAAGFLILVATLLSPRTAHITTFGSISLAAFTVVIYSYLEWKRDGSPSGQ